MAQMADGKPGRPRVAARKAESPNQRRAQLRAMSALEACRARLDEVDHMRVLAEKERNRKVAHAVSVGVTQAEVARILGITGARVNQLVRAGENDNTQESEK